MKFEKYVIVVLAFSTLLIACTSKEKSRQHISDMQIQVDSMLAVAEVLNPEQRAKVDELIKEYVAYSEKYAEDSLGAAYLFESARLNARKPDFQAAIEMFRRVVDKYPGDDLAPKSLLSIGGIYDVILQDYPKAEIAYKELLEKYPLQAQAYGIDIVLKTLGKSPDEILRELQATSGDSSDISNLKLEESTNQ